MHYIPLQERSSRRDRADELCLLTWLGGDENGIDEKAVADFKRIYCRHEVRALLWRKLELLDALVQGLQRKAHHLKVSTAQELKAKQWNPSTTSSRWELGSIKATARSLLDHRTKGTCWRNDSICLLMGQYSQLSQNVGKSLIASVCSLLIHLAISFWTGCLLLHPAYSLNRVDLRASCRWRYTNILITSVNWILELTGTISKRPVWKSISRVPGATKTALTCWNV